MYVLGSRGGHSDRDHITNIVVSLSLSLSPSALSSLKINRCSRQTQRSTLVARPLSLIELERTAAPVVDEQVNEFAPPKIP